MKKLFSLSLILATLGLFAQNPNRGSVQSTSLSYNPAEDGYVLSSVTFKYQFVNCGGEVQVMVDWEDNAVYNGYKKGNKVYYPSDVPSDEWRPNGRVSLGEVQADLYYGNTRMGTVNLTYLVGNFAGCFGETFGVLKMVGLDASSAEYKQNIASFTLRNMRVVRADVKDYGLEEDISLLEKTNESERLVLQGDQYMAQRNYDMAIDAYSQAGRAKPSEAINQKIEAARNAKNAAQQEERANSLISEGDRLMSSGEHEAALRKYESANRVSPNADTEAKINQAKSEIEQVQKEKEEEEESSRESDGDPGSGDSGKAKSKKESEEGNTEKGEGQTEEEGEEDEEDSEDEEGGEESDTTSTSGGGGYDEEYARQQRMNQYYEDRAQATAYNTAAAMEIGASALLLHYFFGELMYQNMGLDQEINLYKGPGQMFSAQFGYGVGSVPIFTNTESEIYDGNNYYYTNETENYTTFMLELSAQFEYWPTFSREFGWGLFASGYGGHGILFQQFSYGGFAGLKAHAGGDLMQLYGEYSIGARYIYHTPWIDPGVNGNGVAEYGYQRLAAGPQFTFDQDNPTDWKQIQVLGILERTTESFRFGNTPAILNWSPGVKFVYNEKNDMSFFAEFVFQYKREGEVEYGYSSDATYNGTLIRAGYHRRIDIHPNSALDIGVASLAKKRIRNFNAWTFAIMQPKLMWAESDEGYHTDGLSLSINPFGVHRTLSYGIFGLHLGLDLSYTALNIAQNGTEVSTSHSAGIEAPVGLRLWLPSTLARYYVEYGRTFHYDLYISTLFNDQKSYYDAQHIEFGLVVPGRSNSSVVGLRWFHAFEEIIPNTGIVPGGVLLTVGLEL